MRNHSEISHELVSRSTGISFRRIDLPCRRRIRLNWRSPSDGSGCRRDSEASCLPLENSEERRARGAGEPVELTSKRSPAGAFPHLRIHEVRGSFALQDLQNLGGRGEDDLVRRLSREARHVWG